MVVGTLEIVPKNQEKRLGELRSEEEVKPSRPQHY